MIAESTASRRELGVGRPDLFEFGVRAIRSFYVSLPILNILDWAGAVRGGDVQCRGPV